MRKKLLILLMSLAMILTFMPMTALAASPAKTAKPLKPAHQSGGTRCLPGGTLDPVTLDDIPGKTQKKSARGGSKELKTMNLLMIVVGFNDVPYDDEYNWSDTIFSEDSNDWSLKKYYLDNSIGQFTFVPANETSAFNEASNTNKYDEANDGIVHVSVDMDHDDWTFESDAHDETWDDALSEAMKAADEYVDFASFDANADGKIENNEVAIGFLIAGGDASNGDNSEATSSTKLMWPHASSGMDAECDGVSINDYIAIAENVVYVLYDDSVIDKFEPFSEDWADEAATIDLNTEATANTENGNALFQFTPDVSGWYSFYSRSIEGYYSDPIGRVIDQNGDEVKRNDDIADDNYNFDVVFYGEEGMTYYLQARDYENIETEFKVGLKETVKPENPEEPDDEDDDDEPDEPVIEQAGIGTLAHELGHYLGLPDYYNVDYDYGGDWGQYNVGEVSIMAGGNWCYVKEGEGDDSTETLRPSPFDAYSRVRLGWIDPIEASDGSAYTITAQNYSTNTGYNVLKIPTESSKEYYLVENRQFNSWDEVLINSYPKEFEKEDDEGETPVGGSYAETGGLVMWHVDEDIMEQYEPDNEINTSYHRPGLMPTFMEYDTDGGFKFIGENVDNFKLFFDQEIYEENYKTAGDFIYLPEYNGASQPADRVLCSTAITLSGKGKDITLNYGVPDHDHSVVKVEGKPATCTEDGNIEYYKCPVCQKMYSDAEGTNKITEAEVVIPAAHRLTHVPAKAATNTAEGNIEYWHCSVCDNYYSDQACAIQITQAQTVIPADPNAGGGGSGGGGGAGGDSSDPADEITAESVIAMINALPASITMADKKAVEAARKAYDSLSSEQKALVSNLNKLEAAEKTIKAAEDSAKAVKDAEALVDALPETITLADKETVETAKASYDALSDDEKASFNADKKAKLDEAVEALRAAELKSASYINKATVTKADVQKAHVLGATSITLGPKVKKIKSAAFKNSNIKTLIVKSKKLTAKKVKGSLKGSKVKTVKVKVSKTKKINKRYLKKYKKTFTKKIVGRKVMVK